MALDTTPHADAPSARLGLPAPVLTDPADVPYDLKALRDALDPVTVIFLQGLAAAMPAAGVSGRYYWATDVKVLFYDDGTSWYQPGSMSPGDLKPTAAGVAPSGWLLCDGKQYPRDTYAVLFSVIGLAWTAVDDGATFNVPDFRGRSPIGAGQGTGLANRLLGARGGAESHVLSLAELPSHNHGVTDPGHAHGVSDPGHAHSLADYGHGHGIGDPGHAHGVGNLGASNSRVVIWTTGSQGGSWIAPGTGSVNTGGAGTGVWTGGPDRAGYGVYAAATGIGIYGSPSGVSVNASGGGGAHDNMPPWAAINWLIKT